MRRVALFSVALFAVAANAASFHMHYQRQMNPFQNIPDVRTLGFCLTECAAVGEAQARLILGDLSGVCTATFASQVGRCLQCLGKSPLAALLTDTIRQKFQDAKRSYESQCAAINSPVTVDLGSAFAVDSSTAPTPAPSASTSTSTSALAAISTTPTSTLSPTGSPSSSVSATGAGYINAPSFGMAAAVMAVFAAV